VHVTASGYVGLEVLRQRLLGAGLPRSRRRWGLVGAVLNRCIQVLIEKLRPDCDCIVVGALSASAIA